MRFDGKRGFPIESWAFRRDFRKRFVNKMMHNATCLVNAMLNERRTDQRFDDIAQKSSFYQRRPDRFRHDRAECTGLH